MNIVSWLPQYQRRIDQAIGDFFDARYSGEEAVEKTFEEALRYAVEWGGKRLRTILAMLAYESIEDKILSDRLLQSLLGIECIHCFTLVHDDLPCMDNDEYRRGKLTVWKQYGETMAILVGDTLQTLGFELLASSGNVHVVREIAHALWDAGVARGQVRDTLQRHDTLSVESLLRLHDEKTGGFIASSLVVGILLAGGSSEQIESFRKFGFLLGRAFQIRDDILDYEGESVILGKKTGKDLELGKGIVSLVGITESKKILQNLKEEMMLLVQDLGDARFFDVVEYVVKREK